MTSSAIEAGARAVWPYFDTMCDAEKAEALAESKRVIEAALASGSLVPAEQLAAERERCAKFLTDRAEKLRLKAARTTSPSEKNAFSRAVELRAAAAAIRALPPASGDCVLKDTNE